MTDQAEDEWVSVVQGSAGLQWDGGAITELAAGDWILIPAHKKHRVERTSSDPPCIWLVMFLPSA
ncbi:MAG: Cupin 2 conserved barrel domain protein [Firmicutes bacterium]|nr:Cupin 2 conserved barrel domain protein [Bacillota bacterium]